MKKSKIIWIILFLFVFIISAVISANYYSKYITEKRQLKIADNIINTAEEGDIQIITKEELQINENVIGILEIPVLELSAPIQEGTNDSTLNVAIGHFPESSYWNGNVALASHNRSRYVHYFERINELQTGDEIIYKTKFGTRKYIVYENKVIESTDWSVIENTSDNILTLITCINNRPDNRLCVRAKVI